MHAPAICEDLDLHVAIFYFRGRGATFGSNLGRVEVGFLELVRLGDLGEVEEYLKVSSRRT